MRLATAVVLVFAATALVADEPCKPVEGHFEARVVPPPSCQAALCTAGRVWGGIQGNYHFEMNAALPAAALGAQSSVLFFTGRSTVALLNGGTVLGTDTGAIDIPPGNGGFASLITFDNNGGQIRLRGQFDPVQGTTSGDYAGTFCNSN